MPNADIGAADRVLNFPTELHFAGFLKHYRTFLWQLFEILMSSRAFFILCSQHDSLWETSDGKGFWIMHAGHFDCDSSDCANAF
jgi:hypothetical protein